MQIDKVPFITDHGHVSKGTVVEGFLSQSYTAQCNQSCDYSIGTVDSHVPWTVRIHVGIRCSNTVIM